LSTVRVFDAEAYLDEAEQETAAAAATTAAPALSRGAAWADVRAEVHGFRAAQPAATPFPRDLRFDSKHRRVCFVSVDPTLATKLQTLFYVDLDEAAAATAPFATGQGAPTVAPGSPTTPVPTLTWRPLVDPAALVRTERLSHEEAMLRERMRVGSNGVAHYMLDAGAELLLFSLGSTLYLAHTGLDPPLRPTAVRGTRLDVKLGGGRRKLLAHVRQGDLWLYDLRTGRERQLTHAAAQPGRSCGIADYVTQARRARVADAVTAGS
jgi:hypothetical protein